jgi:hypothetical protein
MTGLGYCIRLVDGKHIADVNYRGYMFQCDIDETLVETIKRTDVDDDGKEYEIISYRFTDKDVGENLLHTQFLSVEKLKQSYTDFCIQSGITGIK